MPRLALFALAALSVIASLSACGGGDDGDAAQTAEDVAPELVAALGVSATLHSPPVTETFGPDGGTLELADGAILTVPEGAFIEEVELTLAILIPEYGEDVEDARAYYIGTDEDVGELPEPVVLTVSGMGEDTVLAEHDDAEGWRAVSTSTDGDVKIEMTHFSFTKWLLSSCKILFPGNEAAFLICIESIAPGFCVSASLLKERESSSALSTDELVARMNAENFEACEEEFGDDFILQILVGTRQDLEAAGVSQADITKQLGRLENCLELAQFQGRSDGQALAQCGSHLAVPGTSDAAATATATATPTATAAGVPATATVAPTPTAPPQVTASPTAASDAPSLSFVVEPIGEITSEDSLPCVLWPEGTCREYRITFRVGWSGVTGTASIRCGDSGRDQQTYDAPPPSGDILFQLTYGSWQWDFHPTINCALLDGTGKQLDFAGAKVQL